MSGGTSFSKKRLQKASRSSGLEMGGSFVGDRFAASTEAAEFVESDELRRFLSLLFSVASEFPDGFTCSVFFSDS